MARFRMTWGFAYSWLLTHRPPPHIRFVLLGPRVCLHLPSDHISRYRPWCSARSSCHQGLQRDLHPPSHFPGRFRLPVVQRRSSALRAMPGAHKKIPAHWCRDSILVAGRMLRLNLFLYWFRTFPWETNFCLFKDQTKSE